MKTAIHSFLFVFIFVALNLSAQQSYNCTLSGKVSDKDSKVPLPGVTVIVSDKTFTDAVSTDVNGDFKFSNLKPGRVNIKCTMIGFEEVTVPEVLLTTGKQTIINVSIQEKVNEMKEVVIKLDRSKYRARNEFAAVSSQSFSVEETKRYAATLNDPARMAQSFAGVVSSNDESNQIVVRGNSPRGMLWRLEGLEMPNPNHFASSEGATGGGVSMLSANMLSNTDFYSGAFPAEFGNALSGVFDLHFRKGNSNKHEFAAQVGILGLEAAAEGPFSKKYKGSFLINYRYSTLDVLGKLGITFGQSQTPKYQDLAFNINLPAGRKTVFSLFGLGGMSSLGNKAVRDSTKWKESTDKQVEELKQRMGMVGITNTIYFDEKSSLYTVVSLNASQNKYYLDTLNNSYSNQNLATESFTYISARAATTYNRKIDVKNTIRTGVIFSYLNYDLLNKEATAGFSDPQTKVQSKGATYLLQGFYQWKHRLNNQVNIISGLHFTYSFINKKFYIEPRASIEYRFRENQTLALGVGLHNRMDAISTYTTAINSTDPFERTRNHYLDMSRSFHSVLGYNINFLKNFRVKAELYFQYLFSVPVGYGANDYLSTINQNDGFVSVPLKNTGRGMNYGLELTFEKLFSKNYYFLFTASVFDSKYRTDNGRWFNTAYNTRYVFNLLGGKEFVIGKKKINRITTNAKVLWRGGLRQSPVNKAASKAAGYTVYDQTNPFSEKLPDYVRVDLGLGYRKNQKKWNWQVGVEIQNVINRLNVAARVYNPKTQAVEYKKNIGIIPVLFFKVEF